MMRVEAATSLPTFSESHVRIWECVSWAISGVATSPVPEKCMVFSLLLNLCKQYNPGNLEMFFLSSASHMINDL